MPLQSVPQPLPDLGSTPAQTFAVDLMLLFWLIAVGIAIWGAVTESARAERERRRTLATDDNPGPTPGIDGFLDRWGMWSLIFGAAGLVMLGYVSTIAHR